MKKKSTILIIIGVLTAGSLFLALVFSPIRKFNADTASILENTSIIPSASFSQNIKTAHGSGSFQYFSSNFLNIPGYSSSNNKSGKKGGHYSRSGKSSTDGDYSFSDFSDKQKMNANSFAPQTDGAFSSQEKSGQQNAAGSAMGMTIANNTNNSNNIKKTSTKQGFISTTTDLTAAQKKGTTKMSLNGGPPPDESGSTPPPVGNLPAGNGFYSLLLLAALYGFRKFKSA